MITKLITSVIGSRNERQVKKMRKTVDAINNLEPEFEALSDEQLKAKTEEFKKRYRDGESLDDLLPEAFAAVREAGKRELGMRHFDVQLIGGMVLHQGRIAEMATGEGKTLVATLAAYLNALSGNGVHVVTVNDYLAKRDAGWMGRLYGFLGLTTGVVVPEMEHEDKIAAYNADITYATNNELGFDYLRDNMAFAPEQRYQRELNFCIVDEVDSILIDEARTPLIISGAVDDNTNLYLRLNAIVPKLTKQEEEEGPGDYSVDEKSRQIFLTEEGHEHVEDMLVEEGLLSEGDSLYDAGNLILFHHLNACIRAHALYQKNVHYIVRNKEVIIVDEFTGRTMAGRRWSEGLHQAVEAKENVPVQSESQTLASITFQNYFRMYNKLSGMTGTADTEAFELHQIYGLEVTVIPTNKPIQRLDHGDKIYLTEQEKYNAIVEDVKDCVKRKQPVLVGTASIEASELIAKELEKANLPFELLNAKQHAREANIVAHAGRPGAITIATNMAGRGTDIVLGGSLDADLAELGEDADEAKIEQTKAEWQKRHNAVLEAGGLHVIGTERHESRRIDNQLRGRSGRQGDAGSSNFYLSLEDNLMRIFASGKVAGLMKKLGLEEGEAIEHPWVSKAIENAQKKVEGHNFDIRKHLLEFDDVANDQRKVVYGQRRELLETDSISETITRVRADVVGALFSQYVVPGSLDEQWDIEGLTQALAQDMNIQLDIKGWLDDDDKLHEESLRAKVIQAVEDASQQKAETVGDEIWQRVEKDIMLQTLDTQWKEHLAAMDYLRQSINLRGYAQKDPKQEYKREAFEMFSSMLDSVKFETISMLSRIEIRAQEDVEAMEEQHQSQPADMEFTHASSSSLQGDEQAGGEAEAQQPVRREGEKVGRNDPCPCGSGKKYKNCHGKLA